MSSCARIACFETTSSTCSHALVQIDVLPCVWRSAEAVPQLPGCAHVLYIQNYLIPSQVCSSVLVPPYSMPNGDTLQSIASTFGVSLQFLASVNPTLRKPFATLRSLTDVQLGIPFRVDPSSNVTSVLSNIHRAVGCTPRLLSPIIPRNATRFGVDSVCVVPQCSK